MIRLLHFALLAVFALIGCDAAPDDSLSRARRLYTGTDSMGAMPAGVRIITVRNPARLRENSGATMSAVQPGLIFTINDSGNEPLLFALDTTGTLRGTWQIQGAVNHDWEAIAAGPCAQTPAVGSPDSSYSCLYIGDVGDNEAERESVTIYRVREPKAGATDSLSTLSAESLSFRYEKGAHDVEAMFVSRDGALNLITKRPLRGWSFRLRPSLVFRVPASAWGRGPAVAHRVDSLAIVPGSAPNRTITDASLSRDGRYLAVRTYWQVYVFSTDSTTGRVNAPIAPTTCNIATLRERQGEGISWYLDTRKLLVTSEGVSEPMRVIECPLPPG